MSRRRLLELVDEFDDKAFWLMLAFGFGVALAMSGCGPITVGCREHGAHAFTTEHSVTPFEVTVRSDTPMWFVDNRAGTILTVHNPTDHFVGLRVRCFPTDPTGVYGSTYAPGKWDLCLAPHQEKIRLVEFMYIDAIRDVCHVEQEFKESPEKCVEID